MNSFEEVAAQYEPMISALIRKLNIYRDFDGFRQAGRIALWQAWERFDESKGEFTPFVYRSIKGALLDELKKETRYAKYMTGGDEELFERIPAIIHEPDELPEWVVDLGLSADERFLLTALFIDRFTATEVAVLSGITPAGIKKRRERLLKKMQTLLEGDTGISLTK